MRVKLNKEDLGSEQLAWLCVKPVLEGLRGKDMSAKTEAYNELNEGQKALYMFFAYHNHTNTLAEFYWFASYFISEIKGWSPLKNGLSYFEEDILLGNCIEMEQLITTYNKLEDGSWRQALASDLDNDAVLLEQVKALYETYKQLTDHSIQRMNEHIKINSEQYFELIA